MGKLSTREILDRFYKSGVYSPTRIVNVKKFIDVPVLFEYEQSIGKEMVDMDKEEFVYLVRALLTKTISTDKREPFILSDYKIIRTCLIAICEWYSYEVEPINIWLRSPDLKGVSGLMKLLSISSDPITWKDLQDIFKDMRAKGSGDRADYTELVAGLFYCGFYQTSEVVNFKERDINFRLNTIVLPGRTVKINDRTMALLQANHKAYEYRTVRRVVSMRSWRDSYMHFIVDPKMEDDFDKRAEPVVTIVLNKLLSEHIKNNYGLKITFKNIFWLGCYDHIVRKCGEERAYELIMSTRNSDDINELLTYTDEFGVAHLGISPAEIKTHLRMFIKN